MGSLIIRPDLPTRRAHPDYVARRVVPQAWQAELEQIVPRSDTVSWLRLAWYAGPPYEPVGRWVLYEMVPDLRTVDPSWLADIRDTSPRERGRWVADQTVPLYLGGQRWHSASMHSQTAWELFHETTCYPLLFWIIQGDRGGHVWRIEQAEKAYRGLTLEGYDVPNPGALSYAPWDQRVAEQIARYDRLRKWEQARAWTSRTENKTEAGLIVQRETYNAEQEYAKLALRWLDTQIEDAVRDIPRTALPSWSDLPRGDGRFSKESDEIAQRLITETTSAPYED